MRLKLIMLAAPLALLAGCASAPVQDDLAFAMGAESASPYGLFLAGEAALNDGHSQDAIVYFERAQQEAGGHALIGERAFTAALLAGDIQRAAMTAPRGDGDSEGAVRLGRLVTAVEAMAEGDGAVAQSLLAGDKIGFPHRSAAALLSPWAAAMAGDMEAALVRPQVRGDPLVDYFGLLGQAQLFERARRYDEAETSFKAITAGVSPPDMMVLAYGGFLERRGRRDDAVALYDAALSRDPTVEALLEARARAKARRRAPQAQGLKQGGSEAMLAATAAMIAQKQNQMGLAYVRLALHLDPQRSEGLLILGDLMVESGDMEAARAAYRQVPAGSPDHAAAQSKLAWSYQNDEQAETALRMAREASARGSAQARLTLADLLRVNEKYDEAIEVLDGLIAERGTPDWRLHYARGAAYQSVARWSEAEADLQAALRLRPDDPELLNFLGYLWIDRGEHLEEAMAMVRKAVAANPRSGAMVDSLGWAYYRLGDFKQAVETLEKAVELQAGDPEINDHLGDAYWRVGRRDEAYFQWRRVLTLDPDPKIKASAEAKLASGLGADGPAASPKIAEQ